MFRNFALIFVILFQISASAQIVITEPEFPTENDSIIIIFDATQPGAEELLNYAGTLYAHTGVNTNLGDWQHVIGNWGVNAEQPALTRLGANTYQLVIGNPRTFYSVTNPSEKIEALAIVIRSSDGSKQTRPDIFIELFEPGLTLRVDNPSVSVQFGDPLRSPVFAKNNDTIEVKISAAEIGTEISSITLFVNEVQAGQSDDNQLNFNFIASDYNTGANYLMAVGTDTAGNSDTSSFVIFINPEPQNLPLPSGVIPGINYINNNNEVVLVLFAPYKEFVYVIGDFNDWKVDENFYMNKYQVTSDSIFWWISIDSLSIGEEYIFQYLVDGEIRIADPYTEKVSDPWNDQYINASTYPGLKSYPSGKTAEPASYIQTAEEEYAWEITDFERPEKTDLIIYELLIRDFLSTHNYQTLIDTLGYLKKLGINAIELMPINEFEGNESWGYNVSFHFAPDKYYGPKNELKRFIDECHKQGIAVIFDMVLNHSYGQSPLVRLYWNAAQGRPAANNPWFNEVSPNQVFSFGFDFDHEAQETKDYVDRVNRYWLEEYKFDGFRFDFTKGFTNNPGDGGSFDQSRINILKRMADKIWEFDSTAYVILEHFAPDTEEKILADYGMMLWGNMNFEYNEATMGYVSNLSRASYKSRNFNSPHLVTYMESHDEERLMFKNITYGNSSGSYNIKNLSTALNRVQLAAAFFITIPGPKMIWQFGELGYDISIDNPCRVCNKPVLWNYYNQELRQKLYKTYSALISLRQYDAFRSTDFSMNVNTYSKRININHPSMDVTIIGNFYVQPASVVPNFQSTGKWYDYFNGDSIEVTDTQSSFLLEPGEFHIYTTKKLPAPEPDLLTDIEIKNNNLVEEYFLEQNFPNPFNPSTEIIFHIKENSKVLLKIFDILGNEVTTLINEEKPAGIYSVTFDAGNLASGLYIYRLSAGNKHFTKKMLLLK